MRVTGRDRSELSVLVGGIVLLLLLLGFAQLADEVFEGETRQFDEQVLQALRRADDPRTPIGPLWLQLGALDITALGSATVLGLVTLLVVGFLLLQGMARNALFVFVASTGGWLLNTAMKSLFQRPRPDIVPHLRDVYTLSFPSGHAMVSAAVYLTLGALTMRIAKRRATKFYCIASAMFVTFLVGASRVYLGVHYPTDVLAGWLVGMSWALLCWLVERAIERKAGLAKEQAQAS